MDVDEEEVEEEVEEESGVLPYVDISRPNSILQWIRMRNDVPEESGRVVPVGSTYVSTSKQSGTTVVTLTGEHAEIRQRMQHHARTMTANSARMHGTVTRSGRVTKGTRIFSPTTEKRSSRKPALEAAPVEAEEVSSVALEEDKLQQAEGERAMEELRAVVEKDGQEPQRVAEERPVYPPRRSDGLPTQFRVKGLARTGLRSHGRMLVCP
jgi:hypothetical protein